MKSREDEDKDFWKEIIYKDGKLDEEQMFKELSDFRFVMHNVSKVYDHVTGGKLSKIMYTAETVIAEADDLLTKTVEEDVKEATEELLSEQAELRRENEKLKSELERERMRLAGCGVAALGYFTDCHPDYDSASPNWSSRG